MPDLKFEINISLTITDPNQLSADEIEQHLNHPDVKNRICNIFLPLTVAMEGQHNTPCRIDFVRVDKKK